MFLSNLASIVLSVADIVCLSPERNSHIGPFQPLSLIYAIIFKSNFHCLPIKVRGMKVTSFMIPPPPFPAHLGASPLPPHLNFPLNLSAPFLFTLRICIEPPNSPGLIACMINKYKRRSNAKACCRSEGRKTEE